MTENVLALAAEFLYFVNTLLHWENIKLCYILFPSLIKEYFAYQIEGMASYDFAIYQEMIT